MQVEASLHDTREIVRSFRRRGQTVAVVPTMGALHQGHVSLIEAARRDCQVVVPTIFVNPTQFAPDEDFEKYPRTLDEDLRKCEAAGADVVFTPKTTDMYPDGSQSVVVVNEVTGILEGAHRPSHFDGVTTIVAKLFNIVEPDFAYFGQKDFQQQLVIRQMVRDLNFGLEIVTCPIMREADGLAMSSRNRYLSPSERSRALVLNSALSHASGLATQQNSPSRIAEEMRAIFSATTGVDLDYAVVVNPNTLQAAESGCETAVALVAARVGQTRLIDNRILQFR